jgi:hypothetical protein
MAPLVGDSFNTSSHRGACENLEERGRNQIRATFPTAASLRGKRCCLFAAPTNPDNDVGNGAVVRRCRLRMESSLSVVCFTKFALKNVLIRG